MDNLQWYDYLRFGTIAVSLLAMYILSRRASKHWDSYTVRLQDLWWVIIASLFFIAEGSLENILSDLPLGPRTFVAAFVAAVALRAALRREKELIKGHKDFTDT